jgi:crossover junction endodeoxyribonuclease RuvC
MRVLGIDPGSIVTGYGVVDETQGRVVVIDWGTIRAHSDEPVPLRLRRIHQTLAELIRRHAPDEAALESVFVARNVQSALKLGQARGACLLAVGEADLALFEYMPTEVKSAVAGHGHAGKDQMGKMVRVQLGLSGPIPEDAADAIAVAVCHLRRMRSRRRIQGARA